MKKQFKKWLSLALVIATLLTFTACGGEVDTAGVSSEVSSAVQSVKPVSDKVSSKITSNTPVESENEVGNGIAEPVNLDDIPAYSGKPYVIVNNNMPNFSADELTDTSYESYSEPDLLGRCGVAIASCGVEIMPAKGEKRGDISSIKPTGWVQAKYNGISGGYLWNRCHLIGWQLSAENANPKNLITGTRYMNVDGMLVFENMVADYIQETGNHVAYRITPVFEGNNLVCSGVQMEGYSVEDKGDGVLFNVYCYNVQPGITINYATGESVGQQTQKYDDLEESSEYVPPVQSQESVVPPPASSESEINQNTNEQMVYVTKTGKKYHSIPNCGNTKSATLVTLSEALRLTEGPCSRCY